MTAFHDVLFPLDIARRAQVLLARRTEVVTLASGFERRQARWAHARRRWQVGYGVKSLDDLQRIIAFFEARQGRLHAFRFRDWADWRSGPPLAEPTPLDQALATADGTAVTFPLVKRYGDAAAQILRRITRPVPGTVRIAVDGVERTSGVTVDHATGTVTFDAPPPAGATVTAGFAFDVPARFEDDELHIDLSAFRAGAAPDIAIVEIRE